MTTPHVLFADVVPYDVPSTLDALSGPAEGVLRLPLHLWWGHDASFDLRNRDDLLPAYRAIVRDGRSSDEEQLLNRDLLVAVWPALRLPVRCREAWQHAYPELRA